MTSTELTTRSAEVSAMPGEAEWNAALAQASTLAQTQIVPAPFRRKPHDIVAVWLIGREMGLSPMMSMQYINIIEGKPSVTPELMNGRIRAKGHTIDVVTWTATACRLRGTRLDNGQTLEAEFTIEDAQRARLVKDGGNWQKWPKAMLWARALSMLARALFADVIMGASYIPEELGAEVDEDGNIVGADAPTTALPDDLAAHVAGAPIDVDPIEEPEPNGFASLDDTPTTAAPAADGGFTTLPEPEPPTAEELHAEACAKLFKNGWPMKGRSGDLKNADPMTTVPVEDLQYMADNSDVNDAKWGASNAAKRAWCLAEIRRRTGHPSPDEARAAARTPRSGETHADLNNAAAEAAAQDDGLTEFDEAYAASESTPEFPPAAEAPAEPVATPPDIDPADALDAPLNSTWHNALITAMVKYGYATGAADAATRIEALLKAKADKGETYPPNSWARGQILAFREAANATPAQA